ncbi:DEKNAAC104013 [Brettanomyces naardenensis]|uniref:DEKNAAC104013 n=1 Tax=Brettanomyces naardenensis TaxID=13370 RepID=A0A448YPT0_BRENA|nr:DEKNAAC104013 [Brettanomyces naardenensis]
MSVRCISVRRFSIGRPLRGLSSPWVQSDVITRSKSRFQGYCTPITSESQIAPAIEELLQLHKKVGKASHPAMYAWKTADSHISMKKGADNDPILKELRNLRQGYDDCGERGSGDRLMGLLDRMRLVNVLVAVTRWYGGVHLGPARFRCISDCAGEALKKGGYVSVSGKGWVDVAAIDRTTRAK